MSSHPSQTSSTSDETNFGRKVSTASNHSDNLLSSKRDSGIDFESALQSDENKLPHTSDKNINDTIIGESFVEEHSHKEIDSTTTTNTENSVSMNERRNSDSTGNHLNNIKRATLLNPDSINLDERLGFNHRNKKIKNKPIRGVLKNKTSGISYGTGDDDIIVSSPLLTSTPNSISRALIRLYPYLIVCEKILSLLTWTSDDIWSSVLMVLAYITICLYYKLVVTYMGHLLCVLLFFIYSQLDKFVGEQMEAYPTLDDIVYTVSSVSSKFDLLFSPITVLNNNDLRRLLITTVFLSPIYIVITIFFLPKEKLVLTLGVIALSYHSRYSKLARHVLWRFKLVRLISFYITGLDIDGIKGIKRASSYYSSSSSLFATVHKKLLKSSRSGIDSESDLMDNMLKNNKPIRFTYVLFENQRRWLGKGWTNTLFAYERAAWTDEFYNEAPDPESFKLPITVNDDQTNDESENTLSHSSMVWKWVDKGWRLDLSNDNTIELPQTMSKTVANPKPDEGWVYFDNTWKKPSVEDTYSKYTRRRRWIRTAELIRLAPASTKVEALKIKKGTISSPGLSNVTVNVKSKFGPSDNKTNTDADDNDNDDVQAKTSGMSVGLDSGSARSSTENSSLASENDSEDEARDRKVSFSGTTEIRTFDEHGAVMAHKRNPIMGNADSIPEEDERERKNNDEDSSGNNSESYDSDKLI